MFKVEIKLGEQITNAAQFETSDQCTSWVSEHVNQFPEGHTVEISDITQALLSEKEKKEALQYLNETDWYVIRHQETGVPVPPEITLARAEARLKI